MRPDKYILVEDVPVPEPDLHAWGRWFEDSGRQRQVAETFFGDGVVRVSTVFLGLDYDLSGQGPPVLWETRVFGLDRDSPVAHWMERYRSRAAAEAGHEAVAALVRGYLEGMMRKALRDAAPDGYAPAPD